MAGKENLSLQITFLPMMRELFFRINAITIKVLFTFNITFW